MTSAFDLFDQILLNSPTDPSSNTADPNRRDGTPAALEFLANHFIEHGEYHRLFEIRKMQSRHSLGLPLYYTDRPPETTPAQKQLLEQAVLHACREVGQHLMSQGQIQSAWYYLQPLDDANFTRSLFRTAPLNDQNFPEFVEIALYQGAYPELGYRRLLERSGTCNAITTFESIQSYLSLADRICLAGLLVEHLDRELRSNIARAVATQRNQPFAELATDDARWETEPSLADWLATAAAEIRGSLPHLDATHLASIVKIGRWADRAALWQQLIAMCDYGSWLPESLQYPSDPPFTATYRDHRLYFQALLNRSPEFAHELFADKCHAAATVQERHQAAAAWAELLYRIEQPEAAIDVLLTTADTELPGNGNHHLHSDLLNLASLTPQHPKLLDFFRQQQDLLSYSIVRLLSGPLKP